MLQNVKPRDQGLADKEKAERAATAVARDAKLTKIVTPNGTRQLREAAVHVLAAKSIQQDPRVLQARQAAAAAVPAPVVLPPASSAAVGSVVASRSSPIVVRPSLPSKSGPGGALQPPRPPTPPSKVLLALKEKTRVAV